MRLSACVNPLMKPPNPVGNAENYLAIVPKLPGGAKPRPIAWRGKLRQDVAPVTVVLAETL